MAVKQEEDKNHLRSEQQRKIKIDQITLDIKHTGGNRSKTYDEQDVSDIRTHHVINYKISITLKSSSETSHQLRQRSANSDKSQADKPLTQAKMTSQLLSTINKPIRTLDDQEKTDREHTQPEKQREQSKSPEQETDRALPPRRLRNLTIRIYHRLRHSRLRRRDLIDRTRNTLRLPTRTRSNTSILGSPTTRRARSITRLKLELTLPLTRQARRHLAHRLLDGVLYVAALTARIQHITRTHIDRTARTNTILIRRLALASASRTRISRESDLRTRILTIRTTLNTREIESRPAPSEITRHTHTIIIDIRTATETRLLIHHRNIRDRIHNIRSQTHRLLLLNNRSINTRLDKSRNRIRTRHILRKNRNRHT